MRNIKENKKEKTFTVQTPDGKTRVFKTRKGAENHALLRGVTVQVPYIATANTYFWHPQGSASGRRSSEKRRTSEIEDFAAVFEKIPTIMVSGSYSESCNRVYRRMFYEVLRKGEWVDTNLTGLIGEAARWGITVDK
jgi:hypothetical protein